MNVIDILEDFFEYLRQYNFEEIDKEPRFPIKLFSVNDNM